MRYPMGRSFAWCCSAALFVVGCGGEDIIAFRSDDTGGTTSVGGTTSTGGQQGSTSGGAGSTKSATSGYRRAGYGGGPGFHGVVGSDGQPTRHDEELAACINGDFVVRSQLDSEACTAGTLCSPMCESDSDCPSGGSAVPRCVQCPTDLPSDDSCFPADRGCVLECDALGSECPSGMVCSRDGSGRQICMFPDTPLLAGCDGYCAWEREACGEGAPCCDGLVCTPWGTCEVHECLEFSFKCGEGLPACCDGLSCQNGYCQTN